MAEVPEAVKTRHEEIGRATVQSWTAETVRRVEPMMDGTRRVRIEAQRASDTIWKRLGARHEGRHAGTSRWSDHRIGVVLALGEHMSEEECTFWGTRPAGAGSGARMCAPRMFEIERGRRWIGPWTLERRLPKGHAMLSGLETTPMLRSAGWRWHEESGLWTTTNPRCAAACAAFASEAVARSLEENGVPRALHGALRHAPALLPWGNEWVLVARTGSRRGAGRPGARWHQSGANAWGTESFAEAQAAARYAPERLREWLERNDRGTPEGFRRSVRSGDEAGGAATAIGPGRPDKGG